MWEISNYNQVITFLLSVCLGCLYCAIYDIIRAMRRVCLNSFIAITIVDILLWIFYAFVTFIFLISRTNGEIRGYVFCGELSGFVLFRISISKLFFPVLKFIFIKIAGIKNRICRLLEIMYLKIERLALKILEFVIKIYKTAKKLLKNIPKLLYTDKNIANMEKNVDETKTEA